MSEPRNFISLAAVQMSEPSAPLSDPYRGPARAPALEMSQPKSGNPNPAQATPDDDLGAYQEVAPPAQHGAPAPAGSAQGYSYPPQGAYQGPTPPAHAQYGAPPSAGSAQWYPPAQGYPYPPQGAYPVLVVMPPPPQPAPKLGSGLLKGCLAVFCCFLRAGYIPSCDDVCVGDCF